MILKHISNSDFGTEPIKRPFLCFITYFLVNYYKLIFTGSTREYSEIGKNK